MKPIADWLVGQLERWLRARAMLNSNKAGGSARSDVGPEVTPSTETMLQWWLESARDLLVQGRHAQAIACLLDALRFDASLALGVSKHLSGKKVGMADTCLRHCASVLRAMEHNGSAAWGTQPKSCFTHRISVVICSNNEDRFAAVHSSYEQALAGGLFEIIRIPDAHSLAEGYNRGLDQSTGDVVVFSHDDVHILSPFFRAELLAALDAHDLIGVAGATRLAGAIWLSGPPEERRQLVCYPPSNHGGEYLCCLDGPEDERWYGGIQCLDGLFLAIRRDALSSLRFDAERYDGFHFYDLDFTYRAYMAGLRLAVCPRLGLMHESGGKFSSPEWHRYAQRFCEQYGLPATLQVTVAPPVRPMGFQSKTELIAFLAAYFSWHDWRKNANESETPNCGPVAREEPTASPLPEKVFLHAGCGNKRKEQAGPGFQSPQWREIRLDADRSVEPDVVGSITDMQAVPAASVDAVFSSHTLEHLYLHEVPVALAEIRRVLRQTGLTVAWVPDLQAAARLIAEDRLFETVAVSADGPIAPFDMVYSHRALVGRDRAFMAHHCGFTLSTLLAAHKEAGFGSVIGASRIPGFDLQVLATRFPVPVGLLRALAALHFQE